MNEMSPARDEPEVPADSGAARPDDQQDVPKERALVPIEQTERGDGWLTRLLVRIGLRSGATLRDDLTEALAGEGEAGDLFSPEERAMLQNILRLRERRVEDVMVPRVEIDAVDETTSLGDVLLVFEESGHSRLPVYTETLDDPRGMVLIKDLLLHMTKLAARPPRRKTKRKTTTDEKPPERRNGGERPALADLDLDRIDLAAPLSKLNVMRKVLFVPPSMLATDLMARMQATRTQMALVIDEYGGTDGLVSLEDIVEEVVGEIEDEHDDDDVSNQIVQSSEGVWTVDARVELEKITEEIGAVFAPGEKAEDMDTLGGLVFALAGHVPVRGEVVTGMPGFEFRVLDADPRRIRNVQVVQTSLRDKRRKAAAGAGHSASQRAIDRGVAPKPAGKHDE